MQVLGVVFMGSTLSFWPHLPLKKKKKTLERGRFQYFGGLVSIHIQSLLWKC